MPEKLLKKIVDDPSLPASAKLQHLSALYQATVQAMVEVARQAPPPEPGKSPYLTALSASLLGQ